MFIEQGCKLRQGAADNGTAWQSYSVWQEKWQRTGPAFHMPGAASKQSQH